MNKIMKALELAFLNFNKMFDVDCDGNGVVAIGAIISQQGALMAYISEEINDAQRKNSFSRKGVCCLRTLFCFWIIMH